MKAKKPLKRRIKTRWACLLNDSSVVFVYVDHPPNRDTTLFQIVKDATGLLICGADIAGAVYEHVEGNRTVHEYTFSPDYDTSAVEDNQHERKKK